MRYTRLDESPAYVEAREDLRQAELELTLQRERVAARRRALPPGPILDNYTLLEGVHGLASRDDAEREVRLAERFTGPDRH